MIYRVDFRARRVGTAVNASSVFGNISRVLFEICREKTAVSVVEELGRGVLVSDAFVRNDLERFLQSGWSPPGTPPLAPGAGKTVSEKRALYRSYRKQVSWQIRGLEEERTGVRIQVDRTAGTAAEGMLFYDEGRWSGEDGASLYFYVSDEKWLDWLELALKIVEKTGFGTGRTRGKGRLEFHRRAGELLVKDQLMAQRYGAAGGISLNLASTAIGLYPWDDYKFVHYRTARYDGRSWESVRPPLFTAQQGIIENAKGGKSGVFLYSSGKMPVYIYNCVFPVKLG